MCFPFSAEDCSGLNKGRANETLCSLYIYFTVIKVHENTESEITKILQAKQIYCVVTTGLSKQFRKAQNTSGTTCEQRILFDGKFKLFPGQAVKKIARFNFSLFLNVIYQ